MRIIPRCENKDAFKWLIIQIVSRCRAQYNVIYKSCVDSSLCGRFIIGRLELQQCVSTYGKSVEMRLSTMKVSRKGDVCMTSSMGSCQCFWIDY